MSKMRNAKTWRQINGNDISNKCVFSSRLNESTDAADLMFTGNEFHAEKWRNDEETMEKLEKSWIIKASLSGVTQNSMCIKVH